MEPKTELDVGQLCETTFYVALILTLMISFLTV